MKQTLTLALSLLLAATGFAQHHLMPLPLGGTLGTNVGGGTNGVLVGSLTATAPTKAILRGHAEAGLCITADGGLYTSETTPFGEATADDVEVLPATPANGDAVYFGHATDTFARVDVNLTTDGDGTWTIGYEYWDGDSWESLAGVTDGTSSFIAGATGWMSITFTLPEDWASNTVDNVAGYWVRGVVSGYSAVTTAPQVGQGYIIVASADATFTDDSTDFNDSGTGDVALLPTYPVLGDGVFICHSEKYPKVRVTTSQARTGTATLGQKYWDGDSWEALSVVNDDSTGWSASAGALLIHFQPPSDWTANTASNGPGGATGYCISSEITAFTSVTQQPLGTQGWVFPLVTGADGLPAPSKGTVRKISSNALTVSGTTANSVFLVINSTAGTFAPFTWTKAVSAVQSTVSLYFARGDKLVLAQIQEDGTTELAGATLWLEFDD